MFKVFLVYLNCLQIQVSRALIVKNVPSDSDKKLFSFQLQNLFTSLWLSMVIRRTVILQFKCIKFQMAQSRETPFISSPFSCSNENRYEVFPLLIAFFSDKMPNMECNLFLPRNMIRKSYLIWEFITYCRHSTRAFIDSFIDIIFFSIVFPGFSFRQNVFHRFFCVTNLRRNKTFIHFSQSMTLITLDFPLLSLDWTFKDASQNFQIKKFSLAHFKR